MSKMKIQILHSQIYFFFKWKEATDPNNKNIPSVKSPRIYMLRPSIFNNLFEKDQGRLPDILVYIFV